MTDSTQIHRKKASFILAISVTSYSVIATYLYNRHQINLMEYTTPIILSIVLLTLSCAFSQRFFYRHLIKNNVCISFGKQKESIPLEIKQPSIIRKSKCSTDFKRNDFLKKNEAYPLGALRSLKFAYRKLRISLFVELAV